jgi:hypothetical protein
MSVTGVTIRQSIMEEAAKALTPDPCCSKRQGKMKFLGARYALCTSAIVPMKSFLSALVAAAILAGCGGSQTIAPLRATPQNAAHGAS